MSGFKALNIESDEESDIEIDDTKELQIEEALKLYQNAISLHAEGPGSFELAAEAYDQLFQSDIFRYPESQPELRRIELYGPAPEDDDLWQDAIQAGAVLPVGGTDTGPSTLPQVLHLSHKNYAQFKLEYLTARLETFNLTLNQILSDATTALDHFMAALDKDDTDLDLWWRTASVGEILDSKRLARFCLEAVLEGDDESLGDMLSLPGLEQSLASEQLRGLISTLEDQLSLLQSPLPTGKRKVLSKMLKQRLKTYPEIAKRENELRVVAEPQSSREISKVILDAPATWAEVGDLMLRQLTAQQHGTGATQPAAALEFDLGSNAELNDEVWEKAAPSKQANLNQDVQQKIASATDGDLASAQLQLALAESNEQVAAQATVDADTAIAESPTMTLVTRKRSGDAAGLNDGSEEGRNKPKRTRTRESTTVEDSRQALLDANIRWEYEQQINEIQAADDWMFETASGLFEKIGVIGFGFAKNVRQELQSEGQAEETATNGDSHSKDHLKLARSDLQAWLANYSDQLAHFLTVSGEGSDLTPGKGSSRFGSSLNSNSNSNTAFKPPLMSDAGVLQFLREVNNDWLLTKEVAWKWICALLRPQPESESNTYTKFLWPENLKTVVVRTLVNFDEDLLDRARNDLAISEAANDSSAFDTSLAFLAETVFELHLDVFCLIKEPNSGVDDDTITAQKDRLQRWSELTRETMHLRTLTHDSGDPDMADELNLRFLWATTFHIAASTDVTQDHVLECMNELRAIFIAAQEPVIQLQNNAIIPELSVAALDKEISKLTTRDFFLKVTTQDQSDPVALIESLEPLLTALDNDADLSEDGEELPQTTPVSNELVRFLQNSDTSVRLLLWQKLRNAYENINYKPMVVSCYFKMIRMLMHDLKFTLSSDMQQRNRQTLIVKTVRQVHEMTKKVLHLVHNSKDGLECIDEDGLKSAINNYGEVLQLVQVFTVFEDPIRLGQSQPPSHRNGPVFLSFAEVATLVHEMQLNIWIILYSLLKEAIFQFHDLFPSQAEDKFEFLRPVHRNLGLRGICGGSNRMFVRMLKDEFFQMTHIEGYDSEQAQVLYDLYGLNCFLNPNHELMEHNCTHDAFIEKSVALQAVDLLLQQASKLPVKDLAKHSIKDTIERVHGVAPRKKPTDAIMRNREVYRSFLRSTINPLDLYGCLKGEGNQLAISQIPKDDALLASRGWFFLMGHIALAKFRSQKRTAPTPTEDVDIAIAFFMQDLEYSMDNWETWFRLAQAYDTKIEENVVWSAEKLNNSMSELVQLQRAAIHCYSMATSLAYSSADPSYETSEKMSEMFSDFAMRLYASSRPPFDMLPFQLDDTEKFFSLPQGVAKGRPFLPLSKFVAWKLAKTFFRKALNGKPQSWMLHFMLGKCLWKMYQAKESASSQPSAQQVLSSFIRAIELIPDEKKKDSREKREPVLEPHYKLVSIVHKLVARGGITLEQAKEALANTPYAKQGTFPEEPNDWVDYVLTVLKALRATDKSNWHHRMVNRAARIVYNYAKPDDRAVDPSQDLAALRALSAKQELTQQMFTKTMVLQVWRPDSERAGRHFVYTASYTRFFVTILEQLKDRSSLEMLARRVRRRLHDVFEHGQVWQEICHAYLRLLREYSKLADGLETSTFSNVVHEEFLARKDPLEKWMQAQETGVSNVLDVLREVQELKKINQSLMKPGPIDDLIGDAYAHLYMAMGDRLYNEEKRIKQEEEAKRPPPIISPPRNPMMSLTHLMNIDGSNEAAPVPSMPSQPPAATPQPDQAPARRKIGVGRREIRTTAEACFQRSASTATPASTSKATASYPRVQVVIDSARDMAGDISAETSAPGSIHDSADDESELSELEEEGDEESNSPPAQTGDAKPRPIFPGLASQLESREGSMIIDEVEEAGEEDGDGDEDVTMGYKAINADSIATRAGADVQEQPKEQENAAADQ